MKFGSCILGLAAAVLGPCIARCDEPPPVLVVSYENIKEGRSATHEKVEADWVRAFRRAKSPYYWMGWTTMTGPSQAWFSSGYKSWADYAKSQTMSESTSLKNDVDLIDARDGEVRTGSGTLFMEYRKSLSLHGDQANWGKTRYALLAIYHVKLGKQRDFTEGVKSFMAAYEKSNFPFPIIAWELMSGGTAGTYHFIMPIESLEALDSMKKHDANMAGAMGGEALAKLQQGMGDVFESIEYFTLRMNPKMSYLPSEVEDVDPKFWRPKVTAAPTAAPAAKPKEKTAQ